MKEILNSRRWMALTAVTLNLIFWWSFFTYRPFDYGPYLPDDLSWHHGQNIQHASDVPKLPALRQLCDQTQWKEGLILQCYSAAGDTGMSIRGGLNNAHNRIQTCIRMAIDAGATGMVIPSLSLRHPDMVNDTNYATACSSVWFDNDYTVNTLRENCPQLTLNVCPLNDIAVHPITGAADQMIMNDKLWLMDLKTSFHKGAFRQWVENMMQNRERPGETTVVKYGDVYCAWNYRKSDELEPSPIRRELFQTIRHASNLREMGDQIRSHPELDDGAYFGVHLRGGTDWPPSWGSMADQLTLYAEEIDRVHNTFTAGDRVQTIYASSDDNELVERFRRMMKLLGLQVYDMHHLLAERPDLLQQVAEYDFDQKGAVEYQVLASARFFLGTAMSSMSSTIAFERTMHDKEPYFDTYIYPKDAQGMVVPVPRPEIRGTDETSLLVVKDLDLSDFSP